VVSAIQGVIAENWLECRGEILTGPDTYSPQQPAGATAAFTVKSSPADRATSSRVLFQMLLEGAQRRVAISTPYFLPDRSLRRAFSRTARRGVRIDVIVPGDTTDQRWVRLASRRLYGQMLEAGVRIFEYHWGVIGTTNVDNRSFEHNDEVNVAVRDEAVAARLLEDFETDIAHSREVVLDRWRRRPLWEKVIGSVAWVLERQQ
jgi:cardiolipin synthase